MYIIRTSKEGEKTKYEEFDDVIKAFEFSTLCVSKGWNWDIYKLMKDDVDLYEEVFVNELMTITKISRYYANSAYYTLENWRRNKPKEAAQYYKEKFNL